MKYEIRNKVCSFDNLYIAMNKCKQNVIWKDSVAGFVKCGIKNCRLLELDLMNGTYEIQKYHTFVINEPKRREIVSTRMRDRVFQRSLCDNYLTKEITKGFIYDNCACQENKGTKFARDRLKHHLRKHFRKYGLEGYVLKCDLSNFFGSTSHEVAYNAVKKRVKDEWALKEVKRIIDSFNEGEDPNIGMGLGSQVTQLIQLAVLDDLDHIIKEKLHIKGYVRYNDDFILIHKDKEHLKYCKGVIEEEITKLELKLNQKKTQLFPITQNINFLGFRFKLMKDGNVIQKILPEKVSHERRKLKKLVLRVKNGYMTKDQVDKCFESWKAHAKQGDDYFIIRTMEKFYKELWEDLK